MNAEAALPVPTDSAYLPAPLSVGENLCIGGGCGGSTLSGRVDEVRVSRSVLTPDEMEQFDIRGFGVVIR